MIFWTLYVMGFIFVLAGIFANGDITKYSVIEIKKQKTAVFLFGIFLFVLAHVLTRF